MTDSEKRSPWGRAIEAETPKSAWGRPVVEVRRNPWGREVAEAEESKAEAEAELSEAERQAADLIKELGAGYSRWAGVSESAGQSWAANIARRHLDATVAAGGSQEDYLDVLKAHAADMNRRPVAESKRAVSVSQLPRKITEQKGR